MAWWQTCCTTVFTMAWWQTCCTTVLCVEPTFPLFDQSWTECRFFCTVSTLWMLAFQCNGAHPSQVSADCWPEERRWVLRTPSGCSQRAQGRRGRLVTGMISTHANKCTSLIWLVCHGTSTDHIYPGKFPLLSASSQNVLGEKLFLGCNFLLVFHSCR